MISDKTKNIIEESFQSNNLHNVINFMVNNKLDQSPKTIYPLFIHAIEIGYYVLVDYLLSNKVLDIDPSINENKAIILASDKGHVQIVKRLMDDKRVNPGDVDNWAVVSALIKGYVDVAEILISDPRVKLSSYNNWAILRAAGDGHMKSVAFLMYHNKDIKKTDIMLAMQWAEKNKFSKIVTYLKNYL